MWDALADIYLQNEGSNPSMASNFVNHYEENIIWSIYHCHFGIM